MLRKRMRGDDANDDLDEPDEKKTKGKAKKGMFRKTIYCASHVGTELSY